LNLSKQGIGASVGVKGARLGVDATGRPYAAGGRYGLYFRERFGPSRTGQPAGELGANGKGQTPDPRGRRWWVLVVLALVIGIILGVVFAHAGEPARVDFYDPMSGHTGYGRVDGAGKVERFGQTANDRERQPLRSLARTIARDECHHSPSVALRRHNAENLRTIKRAR
jgi:hypothetical protein